ncbi:MAG: acyl carrier protein [Eubacteriales bacterium]|nr:acyl carrier protein [Eubacteriales bacterium]
MYEKLKEILTDEMSINPADISMDAEFIGDLGFNSLELADLVVICEEKFGVEFDDEVLPTMLTVRDVVNYLELNAE